MNMPEKLTKQNKNAIKFYTDYIERLFSDNSPSNDFKVVKTQTNDKLTNAVAVAINSLSLLF
jgi:hypothetical protein